MQYEAEFISDIYVYAKKQGDIAIGAYEFLCNGETVESKIVRLNSPPEEESCSYISVTQKAFLRAAEFMGKYSVALIDPNMDKLCKRGERLNGKKSIKIRYVFRIHCPSRRALSMLMCDGGVVFTPREEQYKNLMKMMLLKFGMSKTPYRNLRINVDYFFQKSSEAEISGIAEFADKEIKFLSKENG